MPGAVGLAFDLIARDRGVAATFNRASVSMDRAASQASRYSAAAARTEEVNARLRISQLEVVAAQERMDAVNASATASLGRQARAEIALIRAQQSRVAAQAEVSSVAAAAAKRSESTVFGVSRKMAVGVGALAAIDLGAHLVKGAISFQKQMSLLQTQVGASRGEVDRMSKAVLGLAGPTATAPEELAKSLYHVESIGLRGAKALDVVRIAAEGAKVGHADLEQTTNSLTSTYASGIKGVQNMSAAMGYLNATVGLGDMRWEDLNKALGSGVLTVVKQYGVNIRDSAAALATFGDNNIRGAQAGTMLRMAVQALAVPAKAGTGVLGELGLTTEGSATALAKLHLSTSTLATDMQTGGLNKALHDLDRHLQSSGVRANQFGQVLTTAFGKRAGPGLQVLIGQLGRFDAKYSESARYAASFGKAWAATQRTAAYGIDKFRGGLQAAGIELGTVLLPGATAVVRFFTNTLGPALSTPFHLLLGAIHIAGSALSAISGAVGGLDGPLGKIGVAALAAYAGFKLFSTIPTLLSSIPQLLTRIEVGVVSAIDDALIWARNMSTSAATVVAGNTAIAESSAATATSVVASGEAASVGWAGLIGPLGAAAVGIGALIMMFHRGSHASQEATNAAKAYSDALQNVGSSATSRAGRATIVDTITKQLAANDVPQTLKDLNAGLHGTQVSGKQFVDAISRSGKPLDAMRARLQDIMLHNRMWGTNGAQQNVVVGYTKTGLAAQKLLSDLNVQHDALSKAARTELVNTKAFAGAAGSIDKTTVSTQLGTQAAQQYATMAGLVVSKNGIVAQSQTSVNAAVQRVATAYNTATTSGNDFLASLNTFSTSAGTAADRSAMIGAILKANAGDTLTFQTALNSAIASVHSLRTDLTSSAKDANQPLGQYTRSLIDLTNGSVKFHSTAAAPLLSDLAGIQSSALAAAQAQYQHSRALLGGKGAADAAITSYTNVKNSLRAQLTQMGLSSGAAQKLTDKYLGVPDRVRTLIEAAGTNPVIDVLNKIGQQLSYLTGHPWKPQVKATSNAKQTADDANKALAGVKSRSVLLSIIPELGPSAPRAKPVPARLNGGIPQGQLIGSGSASGTGSGGLADGWSTVGEQGGSPHSWELVHKRGAHVDIYSNAQSRAMTGWHHVPGYAGGTGSGITHQGKDWLYDGMRYASERAAENARTRAERQTAKAADVVPARFASGIYRVLRGFGFDGQYYGKYKEAAAARVDAIHSAAAAAPNDRAAWRQAIRSMDIDQTRTAYAALVKDTRAAGASRAELLRLSKAEKQIIADLQRRATITAQASKATQYLTDLQSKASEVRGSAYSAVTGTFDLTSSMPAQTFNDVNPVVSGDSILTDITAKADKAVAYRALLDRLAKEGLNKALYLQLVQAGPAAFDQAKALAAITPKQLSAINMQEGRLQGAGAGIGASASTFLYGSQIATATALLNGYDPARNPHMAKAVQTLADRLFGAGKWSAVGIARGLRSQDRTVAREAVRLGTLIEQSIASGMHATPPAKRSGESSGSHGGDTHHHQHTVTHHWTINEADDGMDTANRVVRRMARSGP